MPRTISPSKRLPKDCQDCVIYLTDGRQMVARFYPADAENPFPAWSTGVDTFGTELVKGWHGYYEGRTKAVEAMAVDPTAGVEVRSLVPASD